MFLSVGGLGGAYSVERLEEPDRGRTRTCGDAHPCRIETREGVASSYGDSVLAQRRTHARSEPGEYERRRRRDELDATAAKSGLEERAPLFQCEGALMGFEHRRLCTARCRGGDRRCGDRPWRLAVGEPSHDALLSDQISGSDAGDGPVL